ncbi:hypothetical protein F750_0359 [Streptomyces sp. PAMC 26508]|nr:hypothetical protein F750_0359 [Streptomyces sp. PAMC 26508]
MDPSSSCDLRLAPAGPAVLPLRYRGEGDDREPPRIARTLKEVSTPM